MRTRIWTVAALAGLATLAACKPGGAPEALPHYQGRTLFTCCNIHHEKDDVSDANYSVGSTIPAGTVVQVTASGRDSVTVLANGTKLTLVHEYGAKEESAQQYFDKLLVAEDPKVQIGRFPTAVQDAIRDGRVERGMTREQVLLSLGYPPTHRTASTSAGEWLYWYNRWLTYKVQFDDSGRVSNVVGRPAPTRDQPIVVEAPKPAAAPKRAAKKKLSK